MRLFSTKLHFLTQMHRALKVIVHNHRQYLRPSSILKTTSAKTTRRQKMEIGPNMSKKDFITQAVQSMYPEQAISEDPKRNPKDFERTLVFLCDVQECFRPSIKDFDQVTRSSKILIESAKKFNWPIFATEQVPNKLGRTTEEVLECMKETHGISAVNDQFPIAKSDFGMLRVLLTNNDGSELNTQPNSLCGKESLVKMMYDADEIRVLLVGVEAHVCVYQTVKQIVEHNEKAGQNILKPFVLCDGVQSQRSVDREVALEKMKELGATMTTTEMFLFEEMGGADHENFRDVAKTVRKYK